MKKFFISALLILSNFSFSQNTFIISFKDKPSVSNYNPTDLLSQDALLRRSNNKILIDQYDIPINPNYITSLQTNGMKVLGKSKWLNAVLVETSKSKSEIINLELDLFNDIKIVSNTNSSLNKQTSKAKFKAQAIDYGQFGYFIESYGISGMHDEGFLGENVKVAIIDVGFEKMDTIAAYSHLFSQGQIKDTWNFWTDSSDVYVDHGHGTFVSGYILANTPGSYVGMAPNADVYLYLTDHITTETPQDEFKLVQALERADSLGVEIANISLSYQDFDDPTQNYVDSNKDGQTAISTIGVNIAANKGMLILSGAGNSGVRTSSPGDAFGILAVGGTFINYSYDNISNVGPSYDGRIKPDVSGITRGVVSIDFDGLPVTSSYSGTSGAAPQITGIAVLLKQKHPYATKDELRMAIMNSAHLSSSPDNSIGYGVPNAHKADSLLQEYLSVEDEEIKEPFSIFPNPSDGIIQIKYPEKLNTISIYNINGQLLDVIKSNGENIYNLTAYKGQTVILSIKTQQDKILTSKLILH